MQCLREWWPASTPGKPWHAKFCAGGRFEYHLERNLGDSAAISHPDQQEDSMSLTLSHDKNDTPERIVEQVKSQARRLTTPCGDGEMVWHLWEGDGPPLVLLHGGYGSWGHWIRNVVPLSEHFRVIAADNPGLGESARPPAPHTAEGLGRIVMAGIENILDQGEKPHIVGFSFGSVLGGLAAMMMGERVRSFTLVGAGGLALTRAQTEPLTR
jgi:pimeloyl-ACP methyl ester carboxylesterase